MSEQYKKLVGLLKELFQIDQADLDFGIYRIMNQKAGEISQFLDKDLLPQVKESLALYKSADKTEIKAELDEAIKGAMALGADPGSLPKVRELKAQLEKSVDLSALENEVYSQLYTFFRRYYEGGDFLSLRRYKEGIYAIPYEGEEVKLHWANHDQYYIKSCEQLKNYAFKTEKGRVRFELIKAGTERDNNKAQNGKERRFVLAEQPWKEEDGELVIQFEYRIDEQKRKQEVLNGDSAIKLLNSGLPADWLAGLAQKAPTEKKKERTLFEKHLCSFTAKHNFDYFIHKDLGGFLRRELDFFIKNEVMHLDDIEEETAPRVEQYLSKIKALRAIAKKLIVFLEQLENFQKKLWLKKKFVLESNWCFTLDRVPESFYGEITANEAQREEWVRLFAIDELDDYSSPLTVDFLKAHPFLVLDTRFFSMPPNSEAVGQTIPFKYRLLAEIDDIDQQTDGLLMHSENFQALNLMQERYREQVKCVYIDPPYNTDAAPINYKNGYRNSSYITLLNDRIDLSSYALKDDGVFCITIDDYQHKEVANIIEGCFGKGNILGTVTIRINPSGRVTLKGFAQAHEYALFAASSNAYAIEKMERNEAQQERYNLVDDIGNFEVRNFRREGSSSDRVDRPHRFYPIYVDGETFRIPEMEWDDIHKKYVNIEKTRDNELVVYPIDQTGRERVWRWSIARSKKEHFDIYPKYNNKNVLNIYYKYRPNLDGIRPNTVWHDKKYSATEYGTAILSEIIGDRSLFAFPKSIHATSDCISISGLKNDGETCLDYFAGSGTTGHAVINLNREDEGKRKYILVEMGSYFDTVLKPRIQKVVYSTDWKDGKPTSRDTGVSHCFKYMRLESYEDTLDNLVLQRSEAQDTLLSGQAQLREDYMLGYLLDVETRGSQSLLNIVGFEDPFSYQLKITRDDEAQTVNVDLIETFNYLLGLKVRTMEMIRDVFVLTGKNLAGERILILWRRLADVDNAALDDWFKKQDYSTRDMEFDLIYVNGDNNLENLKTGEERWKVRLIEQEFHRLMFDMGDA